MVSFIVPVYNGEKWLGECISSIRNLQLENYQIVIVDDYSTDNTKRIIEQYRDCPLIQIVFADEVMPTGKRNVSVARNLGIQKAQGEYICFVDSDDVLTGDLSYYDMEKETEDYQLIMSVVNDNRKKGASYSETIEQNNSIRYFLKDAKKIDEQCYLGTLWGKLYLREIINTYKISFDENWTIGEDTYFNLRYMKHVNSIKFIDNFTYVHQDINPMSLSKINTLSAEKKKVLFDEMLSLFERKNVSIVNNDFVYSKFLKYYGNFYAK